MWIRNGTVDVTNGSAVVTAGTTPTSFKTSAVLPGFIFLGPDGRSYEVLSVQSESQITLAENYAGSTASNQAYRIVQQVAAAYSDVLSKVLELLTLYRSSVDLTTLKVGQPTELGAVAAFLGALVSFENSAGLNVRLSKGAAGDTLALEFAAGLAGKARIGMVANNNLVFQYWNGSTWVTVITINTTSGLVTIAGLPDFNTAQVTLYEAPTGTADAIEADAFGPTGSLHILRPTAANTGPVIFKTRPVLDKDGNPLAAGALQPGVHYVLIDDETNFYVIMSGAVL